MLKTYRNAQLDAMAVSLQSLLERRDKIGYIAARNTRIIMDALTEYYRFRNELVAKYGEEIDGQMQLSYTSPKFKQFSQEFKDIQNAQQDLDLMTLDYEDVIGELSGEEILLLDWMLEE